MSRFCAALLGLLTLALLTCGALCHAPGSAPSCAAAAHTCCCRESECHCDMTDNTSSCSMQSSDALALEPVRSARVAAAAVLRGRPIPPTASTSGIDPLQNLQCKEGVSDTPFRPPRALIG